MSQIVRCFHSLPPSLASSRAVSTHSRRPRQTPPKANNIPTASRLTTPLLEPITAGHAEGREGTFLTLSQFAEVSDGVVLTVTGWFAYTQLHAWKETAAESIRVLQLMEDAGALLYCTATSANASASASMTTTPVEFGCLMPAWLQAMRWPTSGPRHIYQLCYFKTIIWSSLSICTVESYSIFHIVQGVSIGSGLTQNWYRTAELCVAG
ncbi:hypothetical protein BGY98DRAFT_932346 [Russula aff. rugulosa BPL654]|nr:hypothetical protein BGY98DRAFT_932346 [Russula aff. rugulosa BPL654]